ncbi:MAG: L-2-amino-thiazoline-4-carboxylic acid hydrolase [Candidatus Bathyarchaeia archaeon]|jgi:predicted ArsR family transcriptional regulator
MMGLRLTLLGWWTPKQVIYRELDRVASKTTGALREIIKNNTALEISSEEIRLTGSLEERRSAMAKQHTVLVAVLVEALGRDRAVILGREALFRVGRELGEESRRRLGVENPYDVVRAAKILYRVLGIEFTVNWLDENRGVMTVHRCALAKEYSELTCQVLSAADEGVMSGLSPNATMKFTEKLTDGCNACTAEITIGEQK